MTESIKEITGVPVIPKDDGLTDAKEALKKVMTFLRKRWSVTTFEVLVCIWFFALAAMVNMVLGLSLAGVISLVIWLMYKRGIET